MVVDLEMFEKAGKKADMIVVFTTGEAVKELLLCSNALVEANEVVGRVKG